MDLYRQTSIKKNLRLRARTIQAIRTFFISNDFLEVETPVRVPAPAPEAYIDPYASEKWFLQTSPELCMKQLLAAGYNRIFQICKCFRANERGKKHLPEFTLLEWYTAGQDYLDMMKQCENLIQFVVSEIGFGKYIQFKGNTIILDSPWQRITVAEAFESYAPVSMEQAIDENRFDDIMDGDIEKKLGLDQPVFLYDYPASKSALSRLKPEDNSLAERFELYIGGLEICNAYTELTDPDEQRKRFEKDLAIREKTMARVWPIPDIFLNVLENMPEAAGNALGIDRLIMLLAGTADVADVVAFIPEEL